MPIIQNYGKNLREMQVTHLWHEGLASAWGQWGLACWCVNWAFPWWTQSHRSQERSLRWFKTDLRNTSTTKGIFCFYLTLLLLWHIHLEFILVFKFLPCKTHCFPRIEASYLVSYYIPSGLGKIGMLIAVGILQFIIFWKVKINGVFVYSESIKLHKMLWGETLPILEATELIFHIYLFFT